MSEPSTFRSQFSGNASLRGCVGHSHESEGPAESQGSAGFSEAARDIALPVGLAMAVTIAVIMLGGWLAWS